MPVTLVITDLDVGGAEKALVALATGLDRRRWEPSVVALSGEGTLASLLREAGIPTECLHADRRRPFRAVLKLARSLRATAPDLVQSFLFHANVASRLAARLAGVHWVVGGLRVAEREKEWHLMLDSLTAWLSAGSVCVSEGVRRYSRDVGRLSPERLVVIANGIDTAELDRAVPASRDSIGVPSVAHLALFVGRHEIQKGLQVLLEAAQKVIASRPDWHLGLVGDGPERAEIVRTIERDSRLTGRVHWLGRRADVASLLKTVDLLVLPSLWEGMPNVVLEAMAARRPVVATRVEGTEDLVVPGQTGWLIPTRDATALASALLEAASDPERCRRFGEAGRARVEAEFTLTRMVESYDRLWSGLLGYDSSPSDFEEGFFP